MSDELFQKLIKIIFYSAVGLGILWITGLGSLAEKAVGGILNLFFAVLGFATSIWGIVIIVALVQRHYSRNS
jgi:hypothetical protein